MGFPKQRMRRLRQNENIRRLVRETRVSVDDLIMPLFVRPGKGIKQPISSMPGNYQMSIDKLTEEAKELEGLGIPGIILFGIPEKKDEMGSGAYADDGIVQKAIIAIKKATKNILVITDVCMCEYTNHGHCGFISKDEKTGHFDVDNDMTLELLVKEAVSHAKAGADIVAPSDMMDGRVAAIRKALDSAGFQYTPIMSYAAKYASAFYGPFREAQDSTPQFGDRKTYQMDPANRREAVREVMMDLEEGADVVMVKPAMPYLDVISDVRAAVDVPVAAYQVSGEYAMIKAAAQNGWIDERAAALESLIAIKRAGADLIITYFAKDIAAALSS